MNKAASRAFTPEEVREQFINRCHAIVDGWLNTRTADVREKLEGVVFSLLVLLDGGSIGFPACEVIPSPHPEDKDYCISQGENYFEPFELPEGAVALHSGGPLELHQLYCDSKKHRG